MDDSPMAVLLTILVCLLVVGGLIFLGGGCQRELKKLETEADKALGPQFKIEGRGWIRFDESGRFVIEKTVPTAEAKP